MGLSLYFVIGLSVYFGFGRLRESIWKPLYIDF